jgi:uncharacterized protein YciI
MLLGLLAASGLATPGAAPSPPIPADIAPHIPRDIRTYYVAFLVTPAEAREMSHEVFVRHQAYMRGQYERGVYRLAGPITDGGRIRGLVILTAASAEEAAAIVAADPAVIEKIFAVEVRPAMLPSLDSLKVEYPERR